MKPVDVIKNQCKANEQEDEGKRSGHVGWSGVGSRNSESVMLDDDALNDIGYVFAAIYGGFEFFVNLFPLQHG